MSPEEWDEKWRKAIADPRERAWARTGKPLSPLMHLLDWFGRPVWKRVLVVGCGISTEPAAIAHLGYEVVAIDVSRVAIDHLQRHAPSRLELAAWLRFRRLGSTGENAMISEADSLAALESLAGGGGAPQFLHTGLAALSVAVSFDVVYFPWSWQCLKPNERAQVPAQVSSLLARGGACRVVTQNARVEQWNEIVEGFSGAGFFHRTVASTEVFEQAQRGERTWDQYQDSLRAEDLQAHRRLDGGEQMFDIYGASG